MHVQLDLMPTAKDCLNNPLMGRLSVLELHQNIYEETAPEAKVLKQIHVEANSRTPTTSPKVAEN